jgi:hypothetical protein
VLFVFGECSRIIHCSFTFYTNQVTKQFKMKPVSELVASWDKPKELWEALKTDPQVRKKLWSAKSRSGTTLSQMLIERTKAQCVEANSSTYELSGPAYDFYTYSFYQEKHGKPKPEALCKLPGEDDVYVKVYATSMNVPCLGEKQAINGRAELLVETWPWIPPHSTAKNYPTKGRIHFMPFVRKFIIYLSRKCSETSAEGRSCPYPEEASVIYHLAECGE